MGDVAVCFSIAIYNKKHLNKTELAATTDSLTGALNRVAYKKDILVTEFIEKELRECAEAAAELDRRMENLSESIIRNEETEE
mgnify:CR=1 FL=1